MEYSSRDRSVVLVAYVGLGIAVVFIIVSILSIVAEIRHSRYALLSEGREAVKQAVPYLVSLPCRQDRERVYIAASKWVDMCVRNGIQTWLVDETRAASLDGGELYPWSRHAHFGYASSTPLVPDDACILVTRTNVAPSVMEACSIGILKKTQRVPAKRPLRSRLHTAVCARKDILDCFRIPMRRRDAFITFVKSDVQVRKFK